MVTTSTMFILPKARTTRKFLKMYFTAEITVHSNWMVMSHWKSDNSKSQTPQNLCVLKFMAVHGKFGNFKSKFTKNFLGTGVKSVSLMMLKLVENQLSRDESSPRRESKPLNKKESKSKLSGNMKFRKCSAKIPIT